MIYQKSIISSLVPYRKGYEFLGWATEEGSDTVVYEKRITGWYDYDIQMGRLHYTTLDLGYDIPEEGTRLYAIWKELDA